MHHASHDTGHTQEGEVFLRDIDTHFVQIPQTGEEEAAETTDEERWGERSAAAAAAVGGRGGEDFGEEHQTDINHE